MGTQTTKEKEPQGINSLSPGSLVFGGGVCAQRIAANLAVHAIDTVVLAGGEASRPSDLPGRVRWLSDVRFIRCTGYAGGFSLRLEHQSAPVHLTVPAIIVAEDDRQTPSYALYGLEPGSRVMALSELEEKRGRFAMGDLDRSGSVVVFLCGLQHEAHPAVARRMLDACLHLQSGPDVKTYFFTGNLKVSANGSEALVHEAKRSGTLFFKFSDDFPVIQKQANNGFTIHYTDELTREPFQLTADWIVVDEAIEPGPRLSELTRFLGIDRDEIGFAQSDNVRRVSNATNRRGIFVAGGARGLHSPAEQSADADQVSLSVLAFLESQCIPRPPTVTIDQGRCARCLTCHRLCPHQAIEIGAHISVVAQACQRCGICTAGCPARAIEMEGLEIDGAALQPKHPTTDGPGAAEPHIVLFGCARSAGQARALARKAGLSWPPFVRFVELPCGGSIASRHLLDAFEAGADGVLLCTCHNGNCQSETGNLEARKRADAIRPLLTAAGVDQERLQTITVAANMGNELLFLVHAFVETLDRLHNPSEEKRNG